MRYFFFILIIFFSNCNSSKSIEDEGRFQGDWNRIKLEVNEEEVEMQPNRIISFRSDNFVFYFNELYKFEHHLTYDSLYLIYPDSLGTDSYVRRFKVEFLDLNKMSLAYKRKMFKDTISFEPLFINYKATYEKID